MEDDVEVVISVPVENPETEEQPEQAPVIVVENDDTGDVWQAVADLRERLVRMEAEMESLRSEVSGVRMTADDAAAAVEDVAQVVVEEIIAAEETALEVPAEPLNEPEDDADDIEPDSARPHWMFRKASDWRRK